MRRATTYFFWMSLLLLFSIQPSLAEEESCEDMPCCAPVQQTVSAESCCQTDMVTPASSEDTECSCTLESRDPQQGPSERALLSHTNFEFKPREIVLLELPKEVIATPRPRPIWPDFHEQVRDQEFVSYSAFPNPPPHTL